MPNIPRNPFHYDRYADKQPSQETEFGFGPGRFPEPTWDYSAGGSKSLIPIADPDRTAQLLELAALRRSDLNNPSDGPLNNHYTTGNTDRWGAQPPLVRERRVPKHPKPKSVRSPRMERHW